MTATPEQPDDVGLALLIENASQEEADVIQREIHDNLWSSTSGLVYVAILKALRKQDHALTRVIFTGDFVQSVQSRENRPDRPFTLERGSGIVAAKTMPPNVDGVVDILIPLYILFPLGKDADPVEQRRIYGHLAAHEAIHATLHHLGTEPFDVHKRKQFGFATLQFIAMASEQAEEHLAEYLSGQVVASTATSADGLEEAFVAFADTLGAQLSTIPEDAPDYHRKRMVVTFEALHILWKSLAYLAAELRQGNDFRPVPDEVQGLAAWPRLVGPWWDEYVRLLGEIPMSTEIDIAATDAVVKKLAAHLQQWALGIGFDLHDTDDGGGWFGIVPNEDGTLW